MSNSKKRRWSNVDDNNDDSNTDQPAKKRRKSNSYEKSTESKSNQDIFNGESPYSLKAAELKHLCTKHGLKVGGNKSQLIARLQNPDSAKRKSKSPKRISVKQVHKMLSDLDIEEPQKVNNCLKKGIQKQYYTIKNESDLNRIILSANCLWCEKQIDVSLRDCLYQADCGDDYCDGGEDGAIQCDGDGGECHDECYGIYITGLCEGSPRFTSGKFHNHCTKCPGFGKCIGDYRESHCTKCNKHWFEGNRGLPCSHCGEAGDLYREELFEDLI